MSKRSVQGFRRRAAAGVYLAAELKKAQFALRRLEDELYYERRDHERRVDGLCEKHARDTYMLQARLEQTTQLLAKVEMLRPIVIEIPRSSASRLLDRIENADTP